MIIQAALSKRHICIKHVASMKGHCCALGYMSQPYATPLNAKTLGSGQIRLRSSASNDDDLSELQSTPIRCPDQDKRASTEQYGPRRHCRLTSRTCNFCCKAKILALKSSVQRSLRARCQAQSYGHSQRTICFHNMAFK